MKTFCVLEQSGRDGDEITANHANIFNSEYSDFYRLNWKLDNDSYAQFFEKNISWSEGRSILYEKVPKYYSYYIFIDLVFARNVNRKACG